MHVRVRAGGSLSSEACQHRYERLLSSKGMSWGIFDAECVVDKGGVQFSSTPLWVFSGRYNEGDGSCRCIEIDPSRKATVLAIPGINTPLTYYLSQEICLDAYYRHPNSYCSLNGSGRRMRDLQRILSYPSSGLTNEDCRALWLKMVRISSVYTQFADSCFVSDLQYSHDVDHLLQFPAKIGPDVLPNDPLSDEDDSQLPGDEMNIVKPALDPPCFQDCDDELNTPLALVPVTHFPSDETSQPYVGPKPTLLSTSTPYMNARPSTATTTGLVLHSTSDAESTTSTPSADATTTDGHVPPMLLPIMGAAGGTAAIFAAAMLLSRFHVISLGGWSAPPVMEMGMDVQAAQTVEEREASVAVQLDMFA